MAGKPAGLVAWEQLFVYSPILLTNGLAGTFPARTLPLAAITEALNFPLGLLGSPTSFSQDKSFATFQPLPGTTLLQYESADYPFANSTVAANTLIKMPTTIAMAMIAPVQQPLGYAEKLAIMEALTTVIDAHVLQGGTFMIATPGQIFFNCLFTSMRDASVSGTKQLQNTWVLEFKKPLLTVSDAQQYENSLMSLITNGGQLQTGLTNAFSGVGSALSSVLAAAGGLLSPSMAATAAGSTAVVSPGIVNPASAGIVVPS